MVDGGVREEPREVGGGSGPNSRRQRHVQAQRVALLLLFRLHGAAGHGLEPPGHRGPQDELGDAGRQVLVRGSRDRVLSSSQRSPARRLLGHHLRQKLRPRRHAAGGLPGGASLPGDLLDQRLARPLPGTSRRWRPRDAAPCGCDVRTRGARARHAEKFEEVGQKRAGSQDVDGFSQEGGESCGGDRRQGSSRPARQSSCSHDHRSREEEGGEGAEEERSDRAAVHFSCSSERRVERGRAEIQAGARRAEREQARGGGGEDGLLPSDGRRQRCQTGAGGGRGSEEETRRVSRSPGG
mmetsp:Transcript_8601/g.19422  ORF Transcript_8601/g.19422 Transcript_8601/m.19422 type:complete len:296 (+) Transcript_8601:1815-2702(+)